MDLGDHDLDFDILLGPGTILLTNQILGHF